MDTQKKYKFIDLFAGMGGFHYAFNELGAECMFACEIDKFARQTYNANYQIAIEYFAEDIKAIDSANIPDHDILCAGFPCQPFSQAGLKKGFNDIRGTLFFDVVRIIKAKRPKVIFLENVKGLLNHDNGRTFSIIKDIITNELQYDFHYEIVKASDFGLPQHRHRLFMIGFRKEDRYNIPFIPPEKLPLKTTMSDIFDGNCNRKIGFTLRASGRCSRITDRQNWDTYLVNDKIKRLTPKEGLMMQGFPKDFKFPVSVTQSMKQLGNSVAINAIKAYGNAIIDRLKEVRSD